jgi:hypothetical protein
MPAASTLAAGHYGKKLLAAIDWALSPDESLRPKNVAEFKAVLTGQASIPAAAAAAAAPEAGPAARPPVLRYAIGAAAVVVVAALVFLLVPKQGTAPAALAPQAGVAAADSAAAGSKPTAQAVEQKKGNSAATVSAKPEKGKEKGSKPEASTVKAAGTSGSKEIPQGVPVAYLVFEVSPSGEVHVDGKKIGNVPPLDKLKVTAGRHKVEVYGNMPPYVYFYSVDLYPDESKVVWAKFTNNLY